MKNIYLPGQVGQGEVRWGDYLFAPSSIFPQWALVGTYILYLGFIIGAEGAVFGPL